MAMRRPHIEGARHEIRAQDPAYPEALSRVSHPPQCLYVIGDPQALKEGIAIVGARKATPYGLSCARHFAEAAARRGVVIISGGARGCDAQAHKAALAVRGITVAFLGGGCDEIYPAENAPLFQRIVDAGGAIVSERKWDFEPLPFTFRERNRLIAGLARATLIVEAGLPSGTFSTADAALAANRDVLVVPGAITSPHSRGANRLIYQGATPVIDDETFDDQLSSLFVCLPDAYQGEGTDGDEVMCVGVCDGTGDATGQVRVTGSCKAQGFADGGRAILEALQAQPLGIDELRDLAAEHVRTEDPLAALMVWLAEASRDGLIAQYPDGRYGSLLK